MFDELIAPLLSTEWGRRVGWGAMILMLLLASGTFIETVMTWRSDYILAHQQRSAANSTFSSDDMTQRIAQIPDLHIFGQGAFDQSGPLPITSLQLRLLGVIKSDPDQYSRVIISEAGKPGRVYQIGDRLTSGVKVYSIDREGVILENGGRLEKLPLARTPLEFQGMPKPLLQQEDEKAQEE